MTHPTDFRTLCAELLEQLGQDWDDEISAPLAARASAALAAQQQGAPSDEDILYLAQSLKLYAIQAVEQGPIIYDIERQALLDLVRLALTRYGAQAVPVAVAERLPGKGDCDAEGRCWWLKERANPDHDLLMPTWHLQRQGPAGTTFFRFTHWLPHWALPLP